ERGRMMPARFGSATYTASPVGSSSQSPGASVSGASTMARKSTPAEPLVARAGISNSRPRRLSSTLTCSACGIVCINVSFPMLVASCRLSCRRQAFGDHGYQACRQLILVGPVQMRLAAIPAHVELIILAIERMTGADDVAGDHVQLFAVTLGACRLFHVVRFGGEAEREYLRMALRDVRDDVAGASQLQNAVIVGLLDFF